MNIYKRSIHENKPNFLIRTNKRLYKKTCIYTRNSSRSPPFHFLSITPFFLVFQTGQVGLGVGSWPSNLLSTMINQPGSDY